MVCEGMHRELRISKARGNTTTPFTWKGFFPCKTVSEGLPHMILSNHFEAAPFQSAKNRKALVFAFKGTGTFSPESRRKDVPRSPIQ